MRRMKLMLVLGLLVISSGLKATDNGHFYKSANLHRNPSTAWFDDLNYYEIEDWLLKIDSNMMYGSSGSSWDKNGNSAKLLNRTGASDFKWIAQNVVQPNVQQVYQDMINNFTVLNAQNPPANFGTLAFDGKFEMYESDYQVRKNLVKGFFVEARVPVRSLKVKDISYVDLSDAAGPLSQQTPAWRQIKNNLDNILGEYGYKPHAATFSKSGLGDISLLVGWEDVFEKKDDDNDDVISLWVSARAGLLVPAGERIKNDYIFSLPTGYNDHWGLTGSVELDMGLLSWLSIDLYGGFTWFYDNNSREVRMKTFAQQNGYIVLAKGMAKEEKGTLWYLGTDVKFDHFYKGLSGILGYSFNRQENDELTPENEILFDKAVVNTDSRLDGWYSHVLHFMLDYDVSLHMKKTSKWAPSVNVFYDLPVDGKNTFKTNMFGAGFGVDLKW